MPGKEEYLDSEKYQLRHWDFDQPGNIQDDIRLLNRLRAERPALREFTSLRFYNAFHDQVLYCGKWDEAAEDYLLFHVLIDPNAPAEFGFEVPLWEFDLPRRGLDRGGGRDPRQPLHLARQGADAAPRPVRAALRHLAPAAPRRAALSGAPHDARVRCVRGPLARARASGDSPAPWFRSGLPPDEGRRRGGRAGRRRDPRRLVPRRGDLPSPRQGLSGLQRRRRWATSRGSCAGSTTCRSSARRPCGSCRSTPRRSGTTATTSPSTRP